MVPTTSMTNKQEKHDIEIMISEYDNTDNMCSCQLQ